MQLHPKNTVRLGKGVAPSESNDSAHCYVRNDNDRTGCSSPDYCPGSGEYAGGQSAGCQADTGIAVPATAPATAAQMTREELLKNDWPWLGRFKEADLVLGPPAADENRVVFQGDSITDMWNLSGPEGSFPGKPYINT